MSDKKKVSPLFPRLGEMSPNGLADNLYAAAQNIEETLLMSGAVPGKDYTRLDLLQLAQPLVLAWATGQTRCDLKWFFPESRG